MARRTARQRRGPRHGLEVKPVPDDARPEAPQPRTTPPPLTSAARRRAAATCSWCGGPLEPKPRGRIPKWCSPACRQRAWEQARAASSGLSAVRIVERRVEVPTPVTPTRRDWAPLLQQLAHQLGDGRIYDRDLPELTAALNAVLEAYNRHPGVRVRSVGLSPR